MEDMRPFASILPSPGRDQRRNFVGPRIDEVEPNAPIGHRTYRRRDRTVGEHPSRGKHDGIRRPTEAPIPYELVADQLVARSIRVRLEHANSTRFALFP